MAQFRYVGDHVRDFPSVPCTVGPGDVVDADENPNPGFFEPVKTTKSGASSATEQE